MMDSFDIYLDAVERIIGFPYAEVVVATVEECFNDGLGVDECAQRLMDHAKGARTSCTCGHAIDPRRPPWCRACSISERR